MITITMNGERKTLAQPLSVAELLEQLGLNARRVAVEVNREVVPRLAHGQRQLAEGDTVEVVTLVGGGSV